MFRQIQPIKFVQFCFYVICIIFILIGMHYTHSYIHNPSSESHCMGRNHQKLEGDTLQPTPTRQHGSHLIEEVVKFTRSKIELDLWNYNFTHSAVDRIEDLVMASGGRPVRSVILTTWRSGSSFMGELLNEMPGTYYSYEPLMYYFRTIQIRRPYDIGRSIKFLKSLLKCKYSDIKYYLDLSKIDPILFRRNTRLWEQCRLIKDLCYDPYSATKLCELYPFQIMKLVRLRLHSFEDIFMDNEMNVKAILLVRDPRAVMLSRRNLTFCQTSDCQDLGLLCAGMISDHEAAGRLLQMYPDKLRVFRYEDIILNLRKVTIALLQFFRLGPIHYFDQYILHHSTVAANGDYSTYRISKTIPFKWKSSSDFQYIKKIQETCKKAMDLWGYQLAHNASHMTSKGFNPLLPYTVTHQ